MDRAENKITITLDQQLVDDFLCAMNADEKNRRKMSYFLIFFAIKIGNEEYQ